MGKGFFMLSKDKLESWRWRNNPNKCYVFWSLLFMANFKPESFEKTVVERGQLIFSYDRLSAELRVPLQTLRTTLRDLVETGDITIKPTRKWSLLTICEYDSWQNAGIQANTQTVTIKGTQPVTITDTNIINNNIENNIKEKDSKESKKKETVYTPEYEKDFALYGRKGSKMKGFERWMQLSEEDKVKMRQHIPYYLQSNERKYLKDFEGYIHQRMFESPVYQGSNIIYDPAQGEQPEDYHPLTDVGQIWDETRHCLILFNGDIDNLNDGYTSDNRPDGATVASGMYSWKWNKAKKQWIQ